MPLIKSAQVPAGTAAFSLRDIENHAKAILLRARERAEALLAEAQQEGENLKTQAHSQGLEEGRLEGLAQGLAEGTKAGAQQALAEHKTQLAELVTTLIAATSDLDVSRRELESEGLGEVVSLAIAIARRVTKRQGLIEPDVLKENVREAMKLAVQAADVRIAIHPQQKSVLEAALPELQQSWPDLKHIELIADPALSPGGCRIFTARGHVDAGLDEQLDRVIADLLPANQESLPA